MYYLLNVNFNSDLKSAFYLSSIPLSNSSDININNYCQQIPTNPSCRGCSQLDYSSDLASEACLKPYKASPNLLA